MTEVKDKNMKEKICKFICKLTNCIVCFGWCCVDGKECLTLANVNELLIKEGHAVEYHGGKR